MKNELLKTVLERMISVKRPYGGFGEGAALTYLLKEVVPDTAITWVDGAGNLHVDCRFSQEHRTLFIAHVDTVHSTHGVNKWCRDEEGYYLALDAPLGADDGAGVALLAVLMQEVPAYYIFARGEERGGIGSKYIADNYPKLLGAFDRAIAFDRRGYADVITHQMMGRCCSDNFAQCLSDILNDEGLLYMPCDEGVYTDTAEFTGLIPECTNISCGYDNEHSSWESLNADYLAALCAAVLKIEWDSLPVTRQPGDDECDALLEEYGFPTTVTADEHDISEAVYAALEGDPDLLMDYVAQEARVPKLQLDREMFEAAEVMAITQESFQWSDVISTLAEEAIPWAH